MTQVYGDSIIVKSTIRKDKMVEIECENGGKYIVFPEEITTIENG